MPVAHMQNVLQYFVLKASLFRRQSQKLDGSVNLFLAEAGD